MQRPIDLRSDTVTRPTAEMRDAMSRAEVGDDVMGDDPTVEELQREIADILGKEAALFMPSGTMSNQIALRVQCKPGDQFLCESKCHIYRYEQGGYAQLSGLVAHTIAGDAGILKLEQLQGLLQPENDHLLHTSLVTLENTHNAGGGTVQPFEVVPSICQWAHEHSLATHLDGARLFNAVAATGIPADRWARHFDSVSVCFSKGLGAPVGSALAGSAELIHRARRARKLLGGAMRQVGIIAAGALLALRHYRERLIEDHRHAQQLAEAVTACDGLSLCSHPQTNIVIFEVDPQLASADALLTLLADHGVLALSIGPGQIRLVTHLDVSAAQVTQACQAIKDASAALLAKR